MNGHGMDQVTESDEHESQSINAPTGRSKDPESNSATCERLSHIHVLDNEGVIILYETAEMITPAAIVAVPRGTRHWLGRFYLVVHVEFHAGSGVFVS